MKLKTPKGVWRKGASVLIGVTTITGMTLTGAGAAYANESSGSITVGATISAADAAAPTIECSWVLTDDNHAGGGETQQYSYAIGADVGPDTSGLTYTNYTQPSQTPGAPASGSPNAPSYGGSPNAATSFLYGLDDDPSLYPSTPNCTSTNTATSQPIQPAGTKAAPVNTDVTVLPNGFDSATNSSATASTAPRRLEIWSAIDNAAAVNFNVFYPDGAEDTDLGGIQIGNTAGGGACSSYGTAGSLLTNMFAAAGPVSAGSNQVSANAITNSSGTGIVNLCNDEEKSLWYQGFTVSKDDPNGTYTIEIQAVNASGTSVAWVSFYVESFYQLAVDFNSVTFPAGAAGTQLFVSGDTTFSPPASTFPTVTNGGNSGEEVGVDFGTLTYTPAVGSPYYITSFDTNLGYNSGDVLGANLDGSAGTTIWITNHTAAAATGAQLVCPNDTPKLDLSAEPSINDASGTYTGTMTVVAETDVVTGAGSGGCVTDNGAPYVVSANGTPAFKSLTDLDQYSLVRS
jgi:hypothetical protein